MKAAPLAFYANGAAFLILGRIALSMTYNNYSN